MMGKSQQFERGSFVVYFIDILELDPRTRAGVSFFHK